MCYFKHRAKRGSIRKSTEIPNTKESKSLCFYCNEHHASTQLRAWGFFKLQILSQLYFLTLSLCPKKVDCQFEVLIIWVELLQVKLTDQISVGITSSSETQNTKNIINGNEPLVINNLITVVLNERKVGSSTVSSMLKLQLTVQKQKSKVRLVLLLE